MLNPQTILQFFLQTADVLSGYYLLVSKKIMFVVGLNENL